MAFGNLLDPPRTRAQLTAGLAANAEHDHLLAKLVYISQDGGVDAFPVEYRSTWTKVCGLMFGKHLFNEVEYIKYVQKDRAHRSLSTWRGVIRVPSENIELFLEHVYERSLPLVRDNINRKQNQSQIAKKRQGEEEAQRAREASSAQAEASSSSAAAFLGPEPPSPKASRATDAPQRTVMSTATSSSGRPDAREAGS